MKNLRARQALARRFGLKFSAFMPKQILATLKAHPEISRMAVPMALLKTATLPGAHRGNGAAGNGSDIPLSAIPDKSERRSFPEETKRAAVAMIGEKSFKEVAREFGVSGLVLSNWAKALDPLARLRLEVERERESKRSRLEQAAMIMELEGARELAIRIRSFARALDGGAKRK